VDGGNGSHLQIAESGILARGERGTPRAILTFGAAVALPSGAMLATCRVGSTKDSDDEHIEIFRSEDGGRSWSAAETLAVTHPNGTPGSPKLCFLTAIPEGRQLAACMWIDRAAHPGKPLFNAETEGCLPMDILLAKSDDEGRTWGSWRRVSTPVEIGPASLTNPILRLADGALAMSIETNKTYLDRGKWFQRVVFFHSQDSGRTWGNPIVAGADATGRIFNWDLRCCVAADGRIAASVDAPFDPSSEIVLYRHGNEAKHDESTGELLAEMGAWAFGLPFAISLPNGETLALYYAGDNAAMDIRWTRLRLTRPARPNEPT
jgi:hypothetical protein